MFPFLFTLSHAGALTLSNLLIVGSVATFETKEITVMSAAPANPDTEVSEGVPSIADEPLYDEERKVGETPLLFRPDAPADESDVNNEHGINLYTAPSISKIFSQLDGLPSIPDAYVLRKRPEQLSTEVGKLALEMGFLLADGFIAVRSGRMNDIKPIALDLSRYGKAIGAGERMNAHSASLLEQAEKGLLPQFKETLSATQGDVNEELRALGDPDLAHLIALGGWIRALNASCAALEASFDAQKAKAIFYPDGPEYFTEMIEGFNPMTYKSIEGKTMIADLTALVKLMTLTKGDPMPTLEKIKAMRLLAEKLSVLCVGEQYH